MCQQRDINRERVNERVWYQNGNRNANGYAYAFLVDAPITFGHSQLVLFTDESMEEQDCFTIAARHIANCIAALRTTIPGALADTRWTALAEYTGTSDECLKTLVLKVSADEDRDVYKIHLVPYFESHFDATNELYRENMELTDEEAKGGLLHWIGEREQTVDRDMLAGRKDSVVIARIASFRLPELKERLSNA